MNKALRLGSMCAGLLLLTACGDQAPSPPVESPPPPAPVVAPAPAVDLYLLTVGGNGFRADTRLADLRQRYGADALSEQALPLGEGETQTGVVIHANDPSRRAYVYFVDGKLDQAVSAIYVRDQGSIWSGPFGIKIGLTSIDLERINGRPFKFLGFDWDYGGYVSNWTDGSLARAFLPPGQLAVRLQPPELPPEVERAAAYPAGDGEFPSDLPAVRQQAPVIVEFGLALPPTSP